MPAFWSGGDILATTWPALYSSPNSQQNSNAGTQLILYKWEDRVYCTPAASAFPLINASLSEDSDGSPLLEVPLDGTKYALTTGAVIEWCPRNNPLRAVLGVLKAKTAPVPLPVYSTLLTDFRDVKLAE